MYPSHHYLCSLMELAGVTFSKYIVHIYSYVGNGELRQHLEIDAHVGGVNDIAFSHPNKQLCIITSRDDKTIKVTGRENPSILFNPFEAKTIAGGHRTSKLDAIELGARPACSMSGTCGSGDTSRRTCTYEPRRLFRVADDSHHVAYEKAEGGCGELVEVPTLPEGLVHMNHAYCSQLQRISTMSHMKKLQVLNEKCLLCRI
eukprot:Gb_33025 [translate_table: standard]